MVGHLKEGTVSVDQSQLRRLIEPVVTGLGFEFWGLEYAAARRQGFVRVFVDAPGGISVYDCSLISQQLGAVFDVEDPMPFPYRLEVSSPGIERPLFEAWQYRRYRGERVKLKLQTPREDRRNLSGILADADDRQVTLTTEEGDWTLSYEEIARCRLVDDRA